MYEEKFNNDSFKTKYLNDGSGFFSGYAAVFNVCDADGDLVSPGCFSDVDVSTMKLLWQHNHDKPIGRIDKLCEDSYGLYIEGHILTDTHSGGDAYKFMKANIVDGLSIGFEILDYNIDKGMRVITKAKLWEVSIVTFPANSSARVYNVKGSENLGENTHAGLLLLQSIEKASQVLNQGLNADSKTPHHGGR